MNISRLSTVALTLVLFTMGALILPVNTAFAHCKGKHLTDPGPPECFLPHGGDDPELPPNFSVKVFLHDHDEDDIHDEVDGNVTVTEVKIKGNRQGLNGTMASPNLDMLDISDLECTIILGAPFMAQFSIATAKIPPSNTVLTYVEANIYDFTAKADDSDARFTLSFVPNGPLNPDAGALFPTESDTPNVLRGIEIGVSLSPDRDECSDTIMHDWTITVSKES